MLLRELLASTPIYEMIGYRKVDIKGLAVNPDDVKDDYIYI